MRVGGNNHGPSMIIGLGEYTGGELWQYDPSGDYEMVVKGDNGNAPHAALPFEGNRMTIVYFTRKNWLNTREGEQRRLEEDYGFPLPEES